MTPPIDSDSSSDTTVSAAAQPGASESATITDATAPTETSTVETTEGAKTDDLKSLIRDVVSKSKGEGSPTPAEGTESVPAVVEVSGEATPKPGESTEPKPDAEDEKLPFHTHPRFKSLIGERNGLREQVANLSDDANQFRAISDYMTQTGLAPDDVNRGFEIMAAVRNDPARAREMLMQTMSHLNGILGETIPADVQQMIDDGEVSETAAKELARARAAAKLETTRREELSQVNQRRDAEAGHVQIVSAVEAWETQIKSRDPDYAAKRQLVLNNIRLANLQTPARNAQEAIVIADKAYAAANETVKAFAPRKAEVKPVPSSGQTVTRPKVQIQTLNDAVRAALVKR